MPDPDMPTHVETALAVLRRGGSLRIAAGFALQDGTQLQLFDVDGEPQDIPVEALVTVYHRPELFITDKGDTPTHCWCRWELPRALQEPKP